jgi:uncharacterized protein
VKVVIAGGTGFLGQRLGASLAADAHDVVVLTRRDSPAAVGRTVRWTPDGRAEGRWIEALDGAAAVVNLAGESIAGKRWTAAQQQRIRDSRLLATRSLVNALGASGTPPPVFVSGSAVGYYGPLGDEIAAEEHPPGDDFLAHVCVDWEREAGQASARTRVVFVRTGLVLDRRAGALPKMLPPFWLGAGGPVGSGRQYWPWIHVDDWVRLVRWAIDSSVVSGPVNATAPNPVTNAAFARELGRALHRPALLRTPGAALRLLLGEMADALLLSGQRAVPAKAMRLGFVPRFPELGGALKAIFH